MNSWKSILAQIVVMIIASVWFYDQFRSQGFQFASLSSDRLCGVLVIIVVTWCAVLINAHASLGRKLRWLQPGVRRGHMRGRPARRHKSRSRRR